MTTRMFSKDVSLTFGGFDIDPAEIERMFGLKVSQSGKRGAPAKEGVKTPLKRSFARFSISLDRERRLDEAVPALLDYLGGVEKINTVYKTVAPEFFEINITWPVKLSDEQEGGFLPLSVIDDLSSMRCMLTFAFL